MTKRGGHERSRIGAEVGEHSISLTLGALYFVFFSGVFAGAVEAVGGWGRALVEERFSSVGVSWDLPVGEEGFEVVEGWGVGFVLEIVDGEGGGDFCEAVVGEGAVEEVEDVFGGRDGLGEEVGEAVGVVGDGFFWLAGEEFFEVGAVLGPA